MVAYWRALTTKAKASEWKPTRWSGHLPEAAFISQIPVPPPTLGDHVDLRVCGGKVPSARAITEAS